MKCRKLETETGLQTRSCGSYLLLYCLNWCIGWNDIENSIAWKVYCLFILNTEVKRHQRNICWKKIVSKFLQFYPCNKYFENANILKYWKILPLEFIPKLCNIGWKIFVKFMTLRKFKAKVWAIYSGLVKEYIWPVMIYSYDAHVTWTLKVEYLKIFSVADLSGFIETSEGPQFT